MATLSGLEGPERQAKAQQALRDLPGQAAQLPGEALNDLGSGGGSGYAPSSSYSDQLDEIQEQNERIERELWDIQDQQQFESLHRDIIGPLAMKHNIIQRHPFTSTGAALLLLLLALDAPWWLIVPVVIVLGMRVTKGRDRRKL